MRRALVFVSLLFLSGCDCSGNVPVPCTSDSECDDGRCIDGQCRPRPTVDGGGDAGEEPPDAGPPITLSAIRIEPASAELVSVDGSRPEQEFDVVAVFSNGMERPATGPVFTIDPIGLGTLDPASGTFVASGIVGGAATITATVPNPAGGTLSATASLLVRVEQTVTGPGVPADVAERFAAPAVPDDGRGAQLVYPLSGAVMPQNVYPADLQWLVGTTGDLFRITLVKPGVRITAYLAHDGTLRNHWLVDAAAWRSLAQTEPDADATITVDRWEAASGQVIAGNPVTLRFARAALTGSVYYWDIARGRIVRIDDGTATRNEFMPTPPPGNEGARCVGCHAVSPSGRYMAGRLGGGENTGTVFDLTTDLTGNPPPSVFPTGRLNWWFATWSPDETRMAVSTNEGITRQMDIYDPIAGVRVPVTGTLPSNITHPAWSPDGLQIAYVTNLDRWGGANTRGDIAVIDVVGPDSFGAQTLLHSGASLAGSIPAGLADSYPTWTPDSRLIAFAHGSGSRSEDQHSALYLMGRDGSGVVRLTNANGGASTTDNFQPRFSPYTQGGYFWLSFLSRRDYGNAEVGTRGRDIQQIWVAAIRTDAAPGEDPSAVAYWLPGQATTSRNISAYWAPRPCRPDGESCSVGSECCGGDCRPGADGALVCSPPPPDRCRVSGETCSTSADCCEGLTCLGNVCVAPPG